MLLELHNNPVGNTKRWGANVGSHLLPFECHGLDKGLERKSLLLLPPWLNLSKISPYFTFRFVLAFGPWLSL